MVKTGARALALSSLLSSVDREVVNATVRAPRVRDLISPLADEIRELLVPLGGTPNMVDRLRPGPWDLELHGGLLVELDEELHFNRYRWLTLDVGWARELPWTSHYLGYCGAFETDCLRAADWGKRWTNPSSERLFGPAGPPREFGNGGAPRWKQRALYDAMKDAFALSQTQYRLSRLSVHDRINGMRIEEILRAPNVEHAEAVANLVDSRAS